MYRKTERFGATFNQLASYSSLDARRTVGSEAAAASDKNAPGVEPGSEGSGLSRAPHLVESAVFDWETPVVEWIAPVFDWEAPVVDWKGPC